MDFKESTNKEPKYQLKIRTKIVTIHFVFELKRGLNQTKGKARGPTHKKAITIPLVLKYHLIPWGFPFRSFPQNLHNIASSCISSAQKGHFFILSGNTIISLMRPTLNFPTAIDYKTCFAG